MEQMLVENLKNKWEPVLNCEGMAPIQDSYRKNVTAILLENQEKALREEANVSGVDQVFSVLLQMILILLLLAD